MHFVSIDNKMALIQVMAWCQKGDKPLVEHMMIQCIDAYMHPKASMG